MVPKITIIKFMKYSIILIAISLFFMAGCKHAEHAKHEESEFIVSSPIRVDTSVNREYVCQIRASNHIELRSMERGYLTKTFVDEGQYVKQGQLMFQIMPLVYQAEAEKSKADVEYAEIEYQNTKILSDKNIVSSQELALAKAKLDREKADLKLTNTHLGLTSIKAPFSGIMDKFQMRLGSLVDEGDLLTTISDNSKLWVYFNVPEAEYLDYAIRIKKEGPQKVKLMMANNEIFNHDGLFETIEADFNNETGNIAFRATFPNPEGILRHGETGTILMPSHVKNALLIPQEATFDILDKKFVFVVDKNGLIQTRQITVGLEMPHIYTVTSGLSQNDKILVEGLRKVKNGDHIKTKFRPYRDVIEELKNLHAE
jgi:membrane fusion protein, multidrug efflux system